MRDKVLAEVRKHFRPEFLNRIDDIILFHRLRRDQMGKIVDIQLARVKKLLEERKISLNLDDEGRKLLADKGYDPAYGARPLKARHPETGPRSALGKNPARRSA